MASMSMLSVTWASMLYFCTKNGCIENVCCAEHTVMLPAPQVDGDGFLSETESVQVSRFLDIKLESRSKMELATIMIKAHSTRRPWVVGA